MLNTTVLETEITRGAEKIDMMKTSKRMAATALCVLAVAGGDLCAQSMAEEMAKFRQERLADMRKFTEERLADMANYRDSINAQYADFLEKTWESFSLFRQGRSFAPMPEPPVYVPRDTLPPEDVEVPVVDLQPLPQVTPTPIPIGPVSPEPVPEPVPVPVESGKRIPAVFFGTRVEVSAAGGPDSRLSGVSEHEVATYWKALSAMPVETWVADAGWGYDHNPCPVEVREGVAYMANRTGCVAAVRENGELLWAEKFASSAANDFFVDSRNRLWITFIEGVIFCLGDPVTR